MYTRREFGTMALAGLAVPRFLDAATSALVNGVRLGVQTYSFRDLPRTPGSDMVDPLIKAMLECELVECELWAPQAEKHKTIVAMHGHSNVTDPNEFATPDSFAAAMKMSKYFKVNLDIGHFTSADFDPVSYIREHHADITNLHLKDRKKHQGDN